MASAEVEDVSPEEAVFLLAGRLKRRLASMVHDLRGIRDQGLKAIKDPSEISLFKGMLRSLDSKYEKFESIWTELGDLNEEQGVQLLIEPEHEQLHATGVRYFYEASSSAETLISTSRISVLGSSVISSNVGRPPPRSSLSTVPIPVFEGDRLKWRSFRDVFEALVIKDNNLTDAERFHFLSGSLRGAAAAIVAKIPATGDNFTIAWEALTKAFDSPRLLAAAYLDELLSIKPLENKPSASAIRALVTKLLEFVAAFHKFEIPDKADFILLHLARKCLDPQTRKSFERAKGGTQFPTFDMLIDFLSEESDACEIADGVKLVSHHPPKPASKFKPKKFAVGYPSSSKDIATLAGSLPPQPSTGSKKASPTIKCFLCSADHALYACEQFKTLSVEERHDALKEWKGCLNCLSAGHQSGACKSRLRCRHCHSKHHSLLHRLRNTPHNSGSMSEASNSASCNLTSLASNLPYLVNTIMGTAVTYLADIAGRPHRMRLVLDSGSHTSFITKGLADHLGLSVKPFDIKIMGIANTQMKGPAGHTTCLILPDHADVRTLPVSPIVVDHIMPAQPRCTLDASIHNSYRAYELADPEFYRPRPVDFLLGCDLLGDVLTGEIITVDPRLPRLMGTIFGFAVIGRIGEICGLSACGSNIIQEERDEELHQEIQRFWALDEPPKAEIISKEDEDIDNWFRKSYQRLPSGRYVVPLPFKETPPYFPGHHTIALKRLLHVEDKLQRNRTHRELYQACLNEYLTLNHMELASSAGRYCLPHHGVYKENPAKVRVVFDASARTQAGSLNDALRVGTKLQNDLPSILLNFRLHTVAFTVDIVKMYRQIVIHPKHRAYQHVLWRPDPSEAVKEYELRTLPFGISSAPYLAMRVIRQLIEDEGKAFPLASRTLREDMYVDDIVTGAASVPEAQLLQSQLIHIMGKGQFPLDKWASTHQELLQFPGGPSLNTPSEGARSMDLEAESFIKILGLQWEPQEDVFSYSVNLPPPIWTKRGTLSLVAKLFDPLGLVAPTVVLAKLLVQQAWKEGLGWDDPLPEDLKRKWSELIQGFPLLKSLRVPRRVFPSEPETAHLLLFADASEVAYCAAAYLRVQTRSVTTSHLLLSRTKLAPLKMMTIPRLELCAALLAARLATGLVHFRSRIACSVETRFFTDSMVVLRWLKNPFSKMPVFIGNRVTKILELTRSDDWFHVRSEQNPSDLGTRGLLPQQLLGNLLWFHGPPWILTPANTWPSQSSPSEIESSPLSSDPVVTVSAASLQAQDLFLMEWMSQFSSWTRLTRAMAWTLRFLHNVRSPFNCRRLGLLNLDEVNQGMYACCRIIQAHIYFQGQLPRKNLPIPRTLLSLAPFICEHGLLRVGGRLRHSQQPVHQKHPILLPNNSPTVKLIVRYYHHVLSHPGPTLLMAVIRQRFWIVGLRSLARQCSRACVTCRRGAAPLLQPQMGDLPAARFQASRAFLHVGVDLGGPFVLRESLRRKANTCKAYLCLFVCLSTKAVHLEAVSNLSTPAFLAALDRFTGRRGLPSRIYSDNGTNFIGAAKKLEERLRWCSQKEVQDAIHNYAVGKGFEWHFIPPHSPHFGGLWEAGIKSTKRLLRVHYGDGVMTHEEFSTVLVKIEAILNSRPLCPLSNDPNDLEVLTPAHFLIGSTMTSMEEPYDLQAPINYRQRWETINRVATHFWNRWKREYLSTLQTRAKWRRPSMNIQVGDLVLLRDDRVTRLHWPRGRVVATHPGADGTVRVVDVKTIQGSFRRPAHHLVPLLPQSDSEIK